jgi:hypothetical protein
MKKLYKQNVILDFGYHIIVTQKILMEAVEMANRPRLGDIQRDYSVIKSDVRDLTNEFKDFKNEVRTKFKEVDRRDVVRLLQEKNSPYTDKFRYTYEEIGNIVDVSTTEVANIAKDEGLSRRGKSQGA